MLKWAKELFPLCRSITGNGTRETLNYFKTINKEFKILKFNKKFEYKKLTKSKVEYNKPNLKKANSLKERIIKTKNI